MPNRVHELPSALHRPGLGDRNRDVYVVASTGDERAQLGSKLRRRLLVDIYWQLRPERHAGGRHVAGYGEFAHSVKDSVGDDERFVALSIGERMPRAQRTDEVRNNPEDHRRRRQ